MYWLGKTLVGDISRLLQKRVLWLCLLPTALLKLHAIKCGPDV